MGDHGELMTLVKSYFQASNSVLLLAFRVAKSQASLWTVATHQTRLTIKSRILALTAEQSFAKKYSKVNLQVLRQTATGIVQTEKVYKLKHLSKVEAVAMDNSGCTFVLGFNNLKAKKVLPPKWIMRNLDDRNQLVTCILKLCKENLGVLPNIVGMDVVEMALWAQEKAKPLPIDGPSSPVPESDLDGSDTVERGLVYKAEEDDMEALLGLYLGIDEAEEFSESLKHELAALEAANVHEILESQPLVKEVLQQLDVATVGVEDMEQWLRIFNLKLRHMGQDIKSIESRNNRLEMQVQNNGALAEELNKLLEWLRVPSKYISLLTSGSFEVTNMPEKEEACEWLAGALCVLEPTFLDSAYFNMLAVRDKLAELEKLKSTFVQRALNFLKNYLSSVVDIMIRDKYYFSPKGPLRRPDHADLRFKCRCYAGLLKHIKILDGNALGSLRKAYCSSLNLLLRRETRAFASKLRTQVKVPREAGAWLEGSDGSSLRSGSDISNVSDAYAKMLKSFIPLLVDESLFFASFMCFEVLPTGPGLPGRGAEENDNDLRPLDKAGSDLDPDQNPFELEALDQALQELLVGVDDDFYAVVDWAYKIDPLRCISMKGVTDKYLARHKTEAAGIVCELLTGLQARISLQFNRFVEEANHQIEIHERRVRQGGVLPYISRFSLLAQGMESFSQGGSREMIDSAYKRLVETMFVALERIAELDPKHADVTRLVNYAAFQNCMLDLTRVAQPLGLYYRQATEAYEQACNRFVSTIINSQFEKIFLFAHRLEYLYTMTPEEVPFQKTFTRADLRKTLDSNLKGVEKPLKEMYKRMERPLSTSEELLPSLREKCKEDFLDRYEGLEALLIKCYPKETLSPSSVEMKELFNNTYLFPQEIK